MDGRTHKHAESNKQLFQSFWASLGRVGRQETVIECGKITLRNRLRKLPYRTVIIEIINILPNELLFC